MVTMSQKEFRRVKVIENAAAETPLSGLRRFSSDGKTSRRKEPLFRVAVMLIIPLLPTAAVATPVLLTVTTEGACEDH
jgi:hypothetical protein